MKIAYNVFGRVYEFTLETYDTLLNCVIRI